MSQFSVDKMSSSFQPIQTELNSVMNINDSKEKHINSTSHNTKSFYDFLKESVDQVNINQHQADTAIKEMIAGRNKNIHETMLAVERADTSLKLMMQVRNKILDAYKEIMRMQV